MTAASGTTTARGPRKGSGERLLDLPVGLVGGIAAAIASIVLTSVLLLALSVDPYTALTALLEGAFGSNFGIGQTVAKTTPILLAGAGIALALSAKLFNIGAEGQIYVGGLAGAWVGLQVPGPPGLQLLGGLVASIVAGGLWAGIAGVLKARRGVNEVIVTLLLNYVAILFVNYLVEGPFKAPGATSPRSEDLPGAALLPKLLPNTQAHVGIIIAVAAAVIGTLVLRRTVLGYRIRMLGGGEKTTRYAGVSVSRLTIGALVISGACAGLAGGIEIFGVHGSLVQNFSPNYGFYALAVALLARGKPVMVVPFAALFGVLLAGANNLQAVTGVPADAISAIDGIIVLCVVAAYAAEELLRERLAKQQVCTQRPTRKGAAAPAVG
jgi:simple sugar transport system permease protein